ncbi:MAG: LytTR family DNA-binding domain-containing protein [Bacteroidota bacterium]
MLSNCVVIDSDRLTHDLLAQTLTEYIPELDILKSAYNGSEGMDILRTHTPDLIFLEVELNDMSGTEMLSQIGELSSLDYQIIFMHADKLHNKNVIKHDSVNYLKKPFDQVELQKLLKPILARRKSKIPAATLTQTPDNREVLSLQLQEGEIQIPMREIFFLRGDRNYTYIHSKPYGKTLVSKTLSHFETNVNSASFFRCHKSFIVNRIHIKNYLPNNRLLLSNNAEIPVARRKKSDFMSWFGARLKK